MLAAAEPSPRGSIASFIIEVSGEMGSIWQLFRDRGWSYLVRKRQQGGSARGHMLPSQENLASLSPVQGQDQLAHSLNVSSGVVLASPFSTLV